MSDSCHDKKMSALLHAYEIGIISDEDRNKFEAHVLECSFCFEELRALAPRGIMIKVSPEIKELFAEIDRRTDHKFSLWQRLWKILWPQGIPTALKPAILMTALLLLLYPAYLGLRISQVGDVSAIEEIMLVQARSPETFEVPSGEDLVLSFMCPRGAPETHYSVTLAHYEGAVIYENDKFSDADSYGVGKLLLPARLISSDTYRLTVRTVGQPPDDMNQVEYVFVIKNIPAFK